MTDEELAAIAERATMATPGPWNTQHEDAASGVFAPAPVSTFAMRGRKRIAIVGSLMDGGSHYYDARFMASSREDVPALLAEVERLRGERNYWRQLAISDVGEVAQEVTALREIVRQVLATADEAGDGVRCPFCGHSDIGIGSFGTHHAEDCRKAEARTLLNPPSASV